MEYVPSRQLMSTYRNEKWSVESAFRVRYSSRENSWTENQSRPVKGAGKEVKLN